ncbi:MAG: radical SAM protein [bacterium]
MPSEPADAPVTPAPPPDLPEGVPPLRSFYIYLSSGCNLRCRHCWIVPRFIDGKPDPGDCVDVDSLREAVREGKTLGLGSAKLTGGEPMLHPRFLEVVDLLTAEGLSLLMETNGTLLTAETARHLKDKTRVTFVSVSLDGSDARTHDAFRNVKGAFDAALKGLSHLADAGFKNTQVIMSVHRGNRAQVEPVVLLAAERGAASVKLNPVTRTGRGITMHERGEALDFDETMELARYVDEDLHPRAPVGVILNIPPALSSRRRLGRSGGSCGDCGVLGILGILGTNRYALCGIGSTCPELTYGQLGKDSVRDIWLNNPTVLRLRRALADPDSFPGICARCIFARVCRTGCVADNYVQSGQLVAPRPLCAEAVRRGLFPPARAQRRAGSPGGVDSGARVGGEEGIS